MITPIQPKNIKFSNDAHTAAQSQVYPILFNIQQCKLSFETVTIDNDPRHQILDGEMAVDRIIKVTVNKLQYPLSFTIQERFRRPEFKRWQDITITEWNYNSNLPSELYKLSGGLFVYGYYNEQINIIEQFVCFSSSQLLLSLARGNLEWTVRKNKKNQSFIGLTFELLRKKNLILFEK